MLTPLITTDILETERLKLRIITPERYQTVFRSFNDQELAVYFGLTTPEALEKEKERHRKGVTTFNKSFLNFLILDKGSKKVLGSCGYHTWYTEHARAEIGYALYDEAYKGQGIMKEAMPPIIRFGFEVMGLNRIEAFIGPENEPSLRLVKRLGFTEEGRLRAHYYKNGRMEDSVVFSLLRDEFVWEEV